jgi:hypothetical protein
MGDYSKIVRKMQRVAETKGRPEPQTVTLTAEEAHVVLQHIRWLSDERESLLRDLPDDD